MMRQVRVFVSHEGTKKPKKLSSFLVGTQIMKVEMGFEAGPLDLKVSFPITGLHGWR